MTNPIIGREHCFLCHEPISEEDEKFFFTGMCSGCREEEQKRDYAEFRRDEIREVDHGVNREGRQ